MKGFDIEFRMDLSSYPGTDWEPMKVWSDIIYLDLEQKRTFSSDFLTENNKNYSRKKKLILYTCRQICLKCFVINMKNLFLVSFSFSWTLFFIKLKYLWKFMFHKIFYIFALKTTSIVDGKMLPTDLSKLD